MQAFSRIVSASVGMIAFACFVAAEIQTSSIVFGQSNESGFFFCKSRDFSIPFNVGSIGRMPSELELEVSSDGGSTWASVQRSQPTIRSFHYVAPNDGIYVFRLKLIDATGRVSISNDGPMQVIIDSEKPTGELSVDIDPRGELVANFLIVEPNLNAESVRVEYRTERDNEWHSVPCALQQGGEMFEVRGTGTWDVPVGTKQLMVRLTAQDQADNRLEVFRYPELPRTAQVGSALQLASQRSQGRSTGLPAMPSVQPPAQDPSLRTNQPLASNPMAQGPVSTQGPAMGLPPYPSAIGTGVVPSARAQNPQMAVREDSIALPRAGLPSSTNPPQPTLVPTLTPKTPGPTASNAPANQQEMIQFGPMAGSLNQETGSNRKDVGGNIDPRGAMGIPTPSIPRTKSNGKFVLTEVSPEEVLRPQTSKKEPNGPTASNASTAPFELPQVDQESMAFPLGAEPFYSNAKTFSLDYDLEINPAIGVQAIELWGTTDGGKTWEVWGADPDRTSPMDVAVEEEGNFGFRIVIISSSGVASNRPIAGDPPDIWVQVDTVAPTVRIVSAQYGMGTEVGSLVIEYQSSDTSLVDRPITLAFSETVNGPWMTIATGIKNEGRYAWSAEAHLPRKVYLKLEAMDKAGNVGLYRLESPIDIQGLTPRGKIHAVRPIR